MFQQKQIEMKANVKKYIIRDREAGNVIDDFQTLELAEKELKELELDDKKRGVYEPDFYEIVESDQE